MMGESLEGVGVAPENSCSGSLSPAASAAATDPLPQSKKRLGRHPAVRDRDPSLVHRHHTPSPGGADAALQGHGRW